MAYSKKKVKVKGYWKFEGLIPTRVREHTRTIKVPTNKRGGSKKGVKKRYGY